MNMSRSKRIEEIAIVLTEQLSVAETTGELDVLKKMHEIFSQMPYYKNNPEDLRTIEVPGDKWGRKSIMAIMRGKKAENKKTISSTI